jgi:fibronectin-binding autotransporter adhesin
LTGTDSGTTPLDWTVSAGTLVVNADSLRGNVMNNGAVHFSQAATGTYAGAISGTGTVTKLGTGTLTLSGASTYSGPTAVDGGTLLVNGSLGNTTVSVAPGARLGGIGTISGTVTIDAGATLAPGLSPGTLTVGSLNLLEGSILDYELATPGVIGGGVNDLIVVANDLTLNGTLDATGLPGFGLGTYRLIDYGVSVVDNQLDLRSMPVRRC